MGIIIHEQAIENFRSHLLTDLFTKLLNLAAIEV